MNQGAAKKSFRLLMIFCILFIVTSCRSNSVPTQMINIPGGQFSVGGLPDEKGLHPLREMVIEGLFIEITEVTNTQYRRCVKAKKCADRSADIPKAFAGGEQPVIMVTQKDAAAYCAYIGRRLPTEWEWERAARGPKGFAYPYGEEFRGGAANTAYAPIIKAKGSLFRFSVPVGAYENDLSGFGVRDMGGNVAEWTQSTVGDGEVVVRGGHWYAEREQSSNYHREFVPTGDLMSHSIGFRCAKSVAR